jgi:hypothetical protein
MRDALSATQVFSGLVDAHVVRFELPVGPAAAPRQVHSVVLNFDGALWLYTPGLGTRSLGAAPAAPASLNAEIADRVRGLDPSLRSVQVYDRPILPPPQDCNDAMRNGCFAGCLYELAQLLSRGESIGAAGVIFFSPRDDDPVRPACVAALGDVGHSVLVYQSGDRWWALDPAQPETPFEIESLQTASAVAPALMNYAQRASFPLGRVRFLPISSGALGDLRRDARWRAYRANSGPASDLSG